MTMKDELIGIKQLLREETTLDRLFARLSSCPGDVDLYLESEERLAAQIGELTQWTLHGALTRQDEGSLLAFHRTIRTFLEMGTRPRSGGNQLSSHLNSIGVRLIKAWIQSELTRMRKRDWSRDLARDPRAFIKNLIHSHPAADHPLYSFLEKEATLEDFCFFITQERTVDAPFSDFIALSQLGADFRTKQEMGKNYWEEMGEGDIVKAHAWMFRRVNQIMQIDESRDEDLLWESLACGNLLVVLNKFKSFHNMGIGALSATEYAVPTRFGRIVNGLERVGADTEVIEYYRMHVEGDIEHSEGWIENIILPLASSGAEAAVDVVNGINLRLQVSLDYCDRIHNALWAANPAYAERGVAANA